MSELNIIRLQHGQSNTPANNFTTTAEAANGTMKLLARGNPGATTQDIITVDASGVVDHPQGLKIAGTSGQRMMLTAAKATTAGTVVDFSPADGTGIPGWAKKITILLDGVSSNGASVFQIQLGTSSGIDSGGYSSHVFRLSNASLTSNTSSATGFACQTGNAAADTLSGRATLTLRSGFTWNMDAMFNTSSGGFTQGNNGQKTLSGVLDRIRLTTQNGTDTFDAGSVSLLIEGY